MSEQIIIPPPDGTPRVPDGIYFRYATINDKLVNGLVSVTAFITTVIGGLIESKEAIFTGIDILTAIGQMLQALGYVAASAGVPLARSLKSPENILGQVYL